MCDSQPKTGKADRLTKWFDIATCCFGTVCVMTLIFSFRPTPVSALKTFCKVEALNGDSVSVKCTYPMNLRDTKQSITMVQFGTNGERLDAAYSCAWRGEQLICVSEKGFFYPSNFTNELTFEVENPYNNAAFSCDTISPDKSLTVERCHLNKEDCSCTASNAALSVVSVILAVVLGAFVFRERQRMRSELNTRRDQPYADVPLQVVQQRDHSEET